MTPQTFFRDVAIYRIINKLRKGSLRGMCRRATAIIINHPSPLHFLITTYRVQLKSSSPLNFYQYYLSLNSSSDLYLPIIIIRF